jgi:hypothetical protein
MNKRPPQPIFPRREAGSVDDLFKTIQDLSNERQTLFDMRDTQKLTDKQRKRIDEITDSLPGLWEQHRRELAAEHYQR